MKRHIVYGRPLCILIINYNLWNIGWPESKKTLNFKNRKKKLTIRNFIYEGLPMQWKLFVPLFDLPLNIIFVMMLKFPIRCTPINAKLICFDEVGNFPRARSVSSLNFPAFSTDSTSLHPVAPATWRRIEAFSKAHRAHFASLTSTLAVSSLILLQLILIQI